MISFFSLEYHFGDTGAQFRNYEYNGYGMEGYLSHFLIKTIELLARAYTGSLYYKKNMSVHMHNIANRTKKNTFFKC
jgi:hypothetical protein